MHALKPMPVIALDGSSAIDRLVVGAACHGYSTASQFHCSRFRWTVLAYWTAI
uniref:Uncharacterized protein n=1 Tax=Physcomitrium patens TaxID=3218 RepID=A0A7I4DXE0_PHYPA